MSVALVPWDGELPRWLPRVASSVSFFDVHHAAVENAKDAVVESIRTLVSKSKISSQDGEAILGRIAFTHDIQRCIADLIIEAVLEKIEVKISLFRELAELNEQHTIFATNTSSLSVTELATRMKHPAKLVGLHFFNPAPVMKLVEVVKTKFSSIEIMEPVLQVVRQMNKTPVICQDAPGFIVNHVARPFYIELLRLVEEGLSNFETIDALLESTGFKMGPFRLMDLIGNDINFAVSCSVYEQLGAPPRLKPSQIQEEKVKLGELGRKTGKGYYEYH